MSTAANLPAREQVDAAVARVLARPEFQGPSRPWDRLVEWCRELAAEWWEWARRVLDLDAETVRQGGVTLLWVAAALTVVLIAYALAGLVRRRPRTTVARAPRTTALARGERSLAAQLDVAAAAVSAGAFLVAAHALYLGVLLWLDGAGHARFAEDKTGAEYEREVRPGALRTAFAGILRAFHPVAYGGRPDAPRAYARMRELASRMGVPER